MLRHGGERFDAHDLRLINADIALHAANLPRLPAGWVREDARVGGLSGSMHMDPSPSAGLWPIRLWAAPRAFFVEEGQ